MSETNGDGIIHFGRKGRKKYQLGDGPVVELDVIDVQNEWRRIDTSFRVDGKIPEDRDEEYQESAKRFAGALLQVDDITGAEAWEFIGKHMVEEVERLQRFFQPTSPDKPESPPSSTTVVTLP
jgi:hypothetical protein